MRFLSSPAFVVAAVWFSAHFGGGFSSGRQIVEFYVRYGHYSLFMPFIAMALLSWAFYYAFSIAVSHRAFDYRSWALKLYQPFEAVGSVVYEVMYLTILFLATAVAFATGGSVLQANLGMDYHLATAVVAAFIFVVTVLGAESVRRFSVAIATVGVAMLIGIYLLVIAKNLSSLQRALEISRSSPGADLTSALWQAVLYAAFQSVAVGSYISIADVLRTKEDCLKAALWGFVLNSATLWASAAGIFAFYPEVVKETVPALLVMRSGLGEAARWIISFLIFIGVVSTGVPLVYGGVKRILKLFGRSGSGSDPVNVAATAFFTLSTWAVALMGLIPLIARGYRGMGYAALPLLLIALIAKGLSSSGSWWNERG